MYFSYLSVKFHFTEWHLGYIYCVTYIDWIVIDFQIKFMLKLNRKCIPFSEISLKLYNI